MTGVSPHPRADEAQVADEAVSMLDRISDGVVELGPDWRFRYLNLAAAEMLRRPREHMLGRSLWSQFPDTAGQPFLAAFEQAMNERRPVALTSFYAPLQRWFEIRGFPQDENLVVLFRDITERRLADEQLREQVGRMAEAERITQFGTWRWELSSGQVRWSDELHRIYGLTPGEFAGTSEAFVSYLHPDDRERIWSAVQRAVDTLEPFAFEERIVAADGRQRVLYSQGRVIAGPDGKAAALVGVCHDVTERSEVQLALGLSERRMRAIIDYTPSIISVKDLQGRYLMANAECARVLGLSPDEIVGRHCTELFPEIGERQRGNDQRATAEREPVYDETVLMRDGQPRQYVTVTFALPNESGSVETCTIGTDVTERKERESARRERLDWAERIGSALRDDRMLVFAQPVVGIATGQPEGYELLVRMQPADPEGELAQPDSFLPAAERFGLVQAIDAWMVRQALRLASTLAPRVNLSAVTLCDADARQEILTLLAAAPQAARRLVFEITETASPDHLDAASRFASALTRLGCGLALDDFGTGFGSFTYLRQLRLRYLKIDRSFVTDMVRSRDDQRVVESVIGIARQFGLRTIAEGIEDEGTLQLLLQLGADYAQGFHLGRPTRLAVAPARPPGLV